MTLQDKKRWPTEQNALHVAANPWNGMTLRYDGKDIRLLDWGAFEGQHVWMP